MGGTKNDFKKSKILLTLFLCLSCHEAPLNNNQNLHGLSIVDTTKESIENSLSNTKNIILFQETSLDTEYTNLIASIQKDIKKLLGSPSLIIHKGNNSLINLEQTKRIQKKLLKEYFLKEIQSNIYYAQQIKKSQLDIQYYKMQLNKFSGTLDIGREDLKNYQNPTRQFFESKGKLLLPTSGRIMKASGEPFASGSVPWNGILISSKASESVKSVAKGEVVFADEFIGFQAVVVIDHDNGYFSIYGNMNPILVRLGQQIRAGQAIGRVGEKNSFDINGLYFEIRKAGASLNSEQWFAN